MVQLKQKYWVPCDDFASELDTLKEKFKGYAFKQGRMNSKDGVYCLSDMSSGKDDYDEPVKSKAIKDAIWFAPKEKPTDIQAFLDSKRKDTTKIHCRVKLDNGLTLWISPATLEPTKLVLSMFDDPEEIPEHSSEYGRYAHELEQKEDITGIEGLKLSVLGLMKSYNINIDIINWLNIISTGDITNLVGGCLGYSMDEEDKKKEDEY